MGTLLAVRFADSAGAWNPGTVPAMDMLTIQQFADAAVGEAVPAAAAAGGVVVDDTEAVSSTVPADQGGDRACGCTAQPPAHEN
jgi:hypothetical protein